MPEPIRAAEMRNSRREIMVAFRCYDSPLPFAVSINANSNRSKIPGLKVIGVFPASAVFFSGVFIAPSMVKFASFSD